MVRRLHREAGAVKPVKIRVSLDGKPKLFEAQKHEETLAKSVNEIGLSIRPKNCMKNAGIEYVFQLVQKSEQQLLDSKFFGRKTLGEIKEVLRGLGLSLGMELDEKTLRAVTALAGVREKPYIRLSEDGKLETNLSREPLRVF